MKRDAALISITRQIAIFNGHVWDRLPEKIQINYRTLAQNILATVERGQLEYRWEFPTGVSAELSAQYHRDLSR